MAKMMKKLEYTLFPCTQRLEHALQEFESALKKKKAELYGDSGSIQLHFTGRHNK